MFGPAVASQLPEQKAVNLAERYRLGPKDTSHMASFHAVFDVPTPFIDLLVK